MSLEEIKVAIMQLSSDERRELATRMDQIEAKERTSAVLPKPFGVAAGQFKLPADFDAPLPEEILQDFEDGAIFPSELTR